MWGIAGEGDSGASQVIAIHALLQELRKGELNDMPKIDSAISQYAEIIKHHVRRPDALRANFLFLRSLDEELMKSFLSAPASMSFAPRRRLLGARQCSG